MGLGIVVTSDFRTVTVRFDAASETRTYAKQSAPLTRVTFAVGDAVNCREGWSMIIDSVNDNNGLITYVGYKEDGTQAILQEGQLDNSIQLSRPLDRLLSGQIDQDKWFELRYETLHHLNQYAHSELRGISGGRTSLIPHQLYIAYEVSNRYAPRVLLADEVGLGKTIEAGMLLHHHLLTERAQRVLIVVPESLLHQWLVEMLRRFNLHFSILDEERCHAIEESAEETNPFFSEQLVLCNLEFLVSNPSRCRQAMEGEWDLLVVDEAHHLQWSPQKSSEEYNIIESLAAVTKGVLLLTATPEQLGQESHFARLHILDPDRFPDYESFRDEEKSYEPIAEIVDALINKQNLAPQQIDTLSSIVQEEECKDLLNYLNQPMAEDHVSDGQEKEDLIQLVDHLLDRHGTGRVLFRNTRSVVKGFPERRVISYPLPMPAPYAALNKEINPRKGSPCLYPERLIGSSVQAGDSGWIHFDPRVSWLVNKLKDLKPEKVLLITAYKSTVIELADALRTMSGIHAAVFHEDLSIVERDRSAAYFSDAEKGAQLLICSEIGSEGRNFQFAHHLILFDLPLNPDLLEQRIGRLDRIGQNQTIQIHVPYLEKSAQAMLFRWYHEGLSAFENTCPTGYSVYRKLEDRLSDVLNDSEGAGLNDLILSTKRLNTAMLEELQRGRNRLLEYNSCRPHIAESLKNQAIKDDADSGLIHYIERVFDCYGINIEPDTEFSHIVKPGDHMLVSSFPALLEDGMTITCDRNTALSNEDMHFLTWDHPMVGGAIDLILSGESGNNAVTAIKVGGKNGGALLLECLYVISGSVNARVQSGRYLPATVIRVVVDQKGNDISARIGHDIINRSRTELKKEVAKNVIKAYPEKIKDMLSSAETHASNRLPAILEVAHKNAKLAFLAEADRLKALSLINSNVREEEIAYFEQQAVIVDESVDAARLQLDALRVIVTL